jgi:hypothetical protein
LSAFCRVWLLRRIQEFMHFLKSWVAASLAFGALCLLPAVVAAQTGPTPPALPDAPSSTLLAQADAQDQPQQPNPVPGDSSNPKQNSSATPETGKQPKRILWVIPNYRAVSADVKVPPLDGHGKFKLMIDDSFDYSAFLYTGFVAALRYGANSYPKLGDGWSGYGQYYWRAFVDQASGDFFTEFLLPVTFKQDPRYFTKGHGGFFNRTGYALSRLAVTRSDKGTEQFNISELAGNLAAAGISNAYYPAPERGIGNTMNNWGVQLALDGGFNVLKEFWPDIARKVLHMQQ